MLSVDKSKVLRPYEVVVIMEPDATDDQQKALFRKNKEIIESFSGSVSHVETWGKRQLANPINKTKKAIFFYSTFMAEPKAVYELERTMLINEKVLRFMHTRLEDDTNLAKHLEGFHNGLKESANREKERETRNLTKKRMDFKSDRPERGERSERGDRPERYEKSERSFGRE